MRRALALALACSAAGAGTAGAQLDGGLRDRLTHPDARLGLAVAAHSTFLRDGNGVSVGALNTGAVDAGLSWRVWRGVRVAAHARASAPRVRISEESDGRSIRRTVGRAPTADVAARLESEVDGHLQFHAGVGSLWLGGPRDVAPFRFANGRGLHRTIDLGGAVRVPRRPEWLTVSVQVFEIGSDNPRARRGPVARSLIGVRRGR